MEYKGFIICIGISGYVAIIPKKPRSTNLYLHTDGVVRGSSIFRGKISSTFDSEKMAMYAIDAYDLRLGSSGKGSIVDMIYPMLYNDPVEYIATPYASFTNGKTYKVHSVNGTAVTIRNNHGSLVVCQKSWFRKVTTKKTRPMTARELLGLSDAGACFIDEDGDEVYNPCIGVIKGVVDIERDHLDKFKGYRLTDGGEILSLTVEVSDGY